MIALDIILIALIFLVDFLIRYRIMRIWNTLWLLLKNALNRNKWDNYKTACAIEFVLMKHHKKKNFLLFEENFNITVKCCDDGETVICKACCLTPGTQAIIRSLSFSSVSFPIKNREIEQSGLRLNRCNQVSVIDWEIALQALGMKTWGKNVGICAKRWKLKWIWPLYKSVEAAALIRGRWAEFIQ